MKALFTIFIFCWMAVTGFAQSPDTDKDGVPDSQDLCPMQAGLPSNKGCPVAESPVTQTPEKSTLRMAKVKNKGKAYTTIARTDCLDWSWATPDQKKKADVNNWGRYEVKDGDAGEVVYTTKHCSTGIPMVILKIGDNYVAMAEEGITYLEPEIDFDKYMSNIDIMNSGAATKPTVTTTTVATTTPKKTTIQKARVKDKGEVFSTISRTNCLDWSWATAEQKKMADEDNWGTFRVRDEAVGEVVHTTKHCSTGSTIVILKIGDKYVPIAETGITYLEPEIDFDKYMSNIDIMTAGVTEKTPAKETPVQKTIVAPQNDKITIEKTSVANALTRLNKYLETFDNGYYGYMEIKDGYVWIRFKSGKYNKFKMEDIEGAVVQEEYKRVIFKCKGNSTCIDTDWKINGKEDYTQFTNGASFNYQELANLLNTFKKAYSEK